MYNVICGTNMQDLNLTNDNQEEANATNLLHMFDVNRRSPFRELTISCSDSDVLFIL